MALKHANRVKMTTATTGTGTITLGSAVSGYQTFAGGGVANSDTVKYLIEDGSNWEIGTGTYTSSGTTMSRSVIESTNSDTAINLSGSATVSIIVEGTHYDSLITSAAVAAGYQPLDADLTSWAGVTRASGFDTFAATPSSANLRALLTDETGTGIAYFVGGALGTPSSATLTNATGLPISGLTSSTSTALGVGSLELGHASDTTLARSAAGVMTIEGVEVVTLSRSQTLTSKTLTDPVITGAIVEDVYTITDGAAFEIDPSNGTIQQVTLGASRTPAATNFASGESVTLKIADGTAYTITWSTVGVVWVGGSAPTLATTGWTIVVLWKDGSTIYGKYVGTVA